MNRKKINTDKIKINKFLFVMVFFLFAIFIGKVFMITFWGYVSKSLIESITDINTIIIVSLMLVMAYIVSKIVSKRVDLD